jgi:hypothetical protein
MPIPFRHIQKGQKPLTVEFWYRAPHTNHGAPLLGSEVVVRFHVYVFMWLGAPLCSFVIPVVVPVMCINQPKNGRKYPPTKNHILLTIIFVKRYVDAICVSCVAGMHCILVALILFDILLLTRNVSTLLFLLFLVEQSQNLQQNQLQSWCDSALLCFVFQHARPFSLRRQWPEKEDCCVGGDRFFRRNTV